MGRSVSSHKYSAELVPISSAVSCRADIVHAICALRDRMRTVFFRDAEIRLSTLATFRGQYVIHDLPRRHTELEVEQAFSIALFGRVLGYRALFDGSGPFEICPQKTVGKKRPDLSIGSFGVGNSHVVVSGELKGPGASLDQPQGGNYGGQTAVEQAFDAARLLPDCRWVILSNVEKLRLYTIDCATEPVAQADLINAYRWNDLLALRTIFGRETLLPLNGERSKMSLLLEQNHPSHPVPPLAGNCRAVFSFSPSKECVLPLYKTETSLRLALLRTWKAVESQIKTAPAFQSLASNGQVGSPSASIPNPALQVLDGWVCWELRHADQSLARVSLSRNGDLSLSMLIQHGNEYQIPINLLETVSFMFFFLLAALFDRTSALDIPQVGSLSAQLLDVEGLSLSLRENSAFGGSFETVESSPRAGQCQSRSILAGPFPWSDRNQLVDAMRSCLCELAAHFRGSNGGVLISDFPGALLLQKALKESWR